MTLSFPTPPTSPPLTLITILPRPRTTPLKAGTPKEAALLSYLTTAIGRVQGRVQNRGRSTGGRREGEEDGVNEMAVKGGEEGREEALEGYESFEETAGDVGGLVDVLWVSGSPNIQIPHLLTLTSLLIDTLPLFPSSPRATCLLLDKLDAAFASLLKGQDVETGAVLPWVKSDVSGGNAVTTTEKVRIKGVVEKMRVVVVGGRGREGEGLNERIVKGEVEDDEGEMRGEDPTTDDDDDGDTLMNDAPPQQPLGDREALPMATFEGFEEENDEQDWEERLAGGVFERTLVELGDVLGGQPIGIITDD